MGTVKYQHQILDFFQKTPVATFPSLTRIVPNTAYLRLLLHNLMKKGKIFRITRGAYALTDDPTLAVFCFKPAYLGLQNALSIHRLWDQATNTIILTTKIVREGSRDIFGNMVLLKRLPSRLFFGIEMKQEGDYYVPVSDLEKTFLDLVFYQQPIGKEVLRRFRKALDKKKLLRYLSRYDTSVKEEVKRLLKL